MRRFRTCGWGQALAIVTSALVPLMHLAAALHLMVAPHRYCGEHARLEAGHRVAQVAHARPSTATALPTDDRSAPHGDGDPHAACTVLGIYEARAVNSGGSSVVAVLKGPGLEPAPPQRPTSVASVDLLTAPKQSPPVGVASC